MIGDNPAKLYIRYADIFGKISCQPINGFCYEGERQFHTPDKFPENTRGEIKCKDCRSNDWTENGRSINEYECAGCGAFVIVEPKNG